MRLLLITQTNIKVGFFCFDKDKKILCWYALMFRYMYCLSYEDYVA
jgi:hypothetical protein